MHGLDACIGDGTLPCTGPEIRDRHIGASCAQGICDGISAVVVGGEHDPAADQYVVAREIAECGVRQHDAGPIIVGEDQRTFDCPGRKHDLLGADAPLRIGLTGAALPQRNEVVVINAVSGGIREHAVAIRLEIGADSGSPLRACPAIDLRTTRQQRTTDDLLIVDQHHRLSFSCSLARCMKAG